MRVLSVGDCVPNGVFHLHARFERAVDFTDGRRVVSVVTRHVGAGPATIVVDAPGGPGGAASTGELPGPPGGITIAGAGARGRAISIGGRALDTGGAVSYESSVDLPRWSRRALAANLVSLERFLAAQAPPLSLAFLLDPSRLRDFRPGFERGVAAHLRDCAADALHGDVIRAARRIAGCGFGLTPSGDDFVCGLLVAMRVGETADGVSRWPLRREIGAAARTGNILTDAFLSHACEGRVSARTKALLLALVAGGGAQADVIAAARGVVSVGETSGADFATGLLLQLRVYTPPSVAAPARTPGASPWGDMVCH